jgi:hypothetical protein
MLYQGYVCFGRQMRQSRSSWAYLLRQMMYWWIMLAVLVTGVVSVVEREVAQLQ